MQEVATPGTSEPGRPAAPMVVSAHATELDGDPDAEEAQEELSIWRYQSIFPPGPVMQQWNDAERGSAKRFIDMMHEEQLHRQAMERAQHELSRLIIVNESHNERLGITVGGTITVVAIVGAVVCVMSGYGGWGVAIAIAEIVRRGATWAWGAKLRVDANERTPSARELDHQKGARGRGIGSPPSDDGDTPALGPQTR